MRFSSVSDEVFIDWMAQKPWRDRIRGRSIAVYYRLERWVFIVSSTERSKPWYEWAPITSYRPDRIGD